MTDEIWNMAEDLAAFYTEDYDLYCYLRDELDLGKVLVYSRKGVEYAWQFMFPRDLKNEVSKKKSAFQEAHSKGLPEAED